MGGGEGREFKVLLRSSLTTCRLGSELSPTDSETTLMAKCTNSLQACSDTLRPVKDWDQLNFTVFTMYCKHNYSKMKCNEIM